MQAALSHQPSRMREITLEREILAIRKNVVTARCDLLNVDKEMRKLNKRKHTLNTQISKLQQEQSDLELQLKMLQKKMKKQARLSAAEPTRVPRRTVPPPQPARSRALLQKRLNAQNKKIHIPKALQIAKATGLKYKL